jgi:PAS domain S-box-containing protein
MHASSIMTITSHRFRAFHGFSLLLALVIAALGASVLIGWAFDISALKSVFQGMANMKANTALGMILCGVVLALLSYKKTGTPTRIWTAGLSIGVIALGALTLSEDLFGWNLGIDQWLFHDTGGLAKNSSPGRFSPSTAFCLMMAGGALSAASQPNRRRWRQPIVTALGAAVMTIGGLALTGYATDALMERQLWNYTGIALHTAAGFLLLGCGLLTLVRNEGGLTWSLDKLTTIGFAVGIVSLLAATGLSYNFTNRLFEAAKWVNHTQEVLKEVEKIRASMADLESGQRGYIITGDEHLMEQRTEIKDDVRKGLDAIHRLTADNSLQQLRLEALDPLIISRIEFGEQTILARRQQGFSAAEQMLTTGKGPGLTDDIDRRLKEMSDEEYRLLLLRQKESSVASTTTFLLLPLGVYLSLTILFLELFFLNAGIGEQAQTEKKLRASLRDVGDLQTALDEHAIVATTDPQGKITYVNDKFCAISKFSREELLGQDHRIINSGHHPKAFIRDLWTTIGQGRVWHGELKNRAKDGSFYWVDTTIVPFLNEQGKVRQYVAIRADITERKLAEEASAQLAAIVNSSNDAIIGKDLNSIVTSWNIGAEKIFGYSSNEMIGAPITRIIPSERQQEELQIIDRVKHGGIVEHFDTVRVAKDGRLIDISVTVSPIKDKTGKVVGASKVVRDITERKRAEQEINELNVRLEQRVAERTAELEAANKELEAFSYSVSHDLRAPLRAVDGFSQAVLEDYGPQLPEEGLRYLKTIRDGAQRMGTLIDDLLTFSRLSRTPLKKQAIDANNLVRHVLEGLNVQREGRQIEIRIGDLPGCEGDPALLNQVWINLLSNAFKYTRQRHPAVIEIGSKLEQDEKIYFVRDNGAGFDMRYAHKLFGVFQRLHRADEFEGTGVGLAIVQRVIHRHGGRIWANAEVDRGATFYFTLQEKAGP